MASPTRLCGRLRSRCCSFHLTRHIHLLAARLRSSLCHSWAPHSKSRPLVLPPSSHARCQWTSLQGRTYSGPVPALLAAAVADTVEEQGGQSFPASDPPSWTGSTI